VKKIPKEESYSVMKDWLDKCDQIEKLNFNPKIKIKEGQRLLSNKSREVKRRRRSII
jgi:hypothetical protein